MYRGDGRDDESSSCKYVGIEVGGRGMDCGIGDGGCSGNGDLFVPKSLLAGCPISSGSIPLVGIGFLLGDDCL